MKKTRYNKYSEYLLKTFGERIQKIPINAGFTCPNRDGSKGVGGCTYCNNVSFNPFYSQHNNDIERQIADGIKFYSVRYGVKKFLAYFQAYTNTYDDLAQLKLMYEKALNQPGIVGILLGTRPDCVSNELLNYLEQLSDEHYLSVEYGIESSHDNTLQDINRCHTYDESMDAIEITAERNIRVGAHIILGLPGETEEMMIETAKRISNLPLNSLKIHQLQIIKQTVMAKQYKEHPDLFHNLSLESYINLVIKLLEHLNPSIVIERFISESPPELIIHPNWKGKRTYEISEMIEEELIKMNSWQGKYYLSNSYRK
jgi:radical SAM protein (TIGR01212 family)